MTKNKETYVCAMCGGIFERTTPEEKTIAELHEMFGGDVSPEECDIVCDDCWQKIRPDKNSEELKAWREERESGD